FFTSIKITMKTLQTTLAVSIAALLTGVASSAVYASDIQVKVNERAVNAPQRKIPQPAGQQARINAPKRYMIQLEEPSVATYKGGIAGYAATSATVTGHEKMPLGTKAVKDYASFVHKRQKDVFANVAQRVP